jgi:hypothetical protein
MLWMYASPQEQHDMPTPFLLETKWVLNLDPFQISTRTASHYYCLLMLLFANLSVPVRSDKSSGMGVECGIWQLISRWGLHPNVRW